MSGLWRWIAVGALAANLALLASWFWVQAPPADDDGALPPLDPTVPHLPLVSELVENTPALGGERCFSIGPLPTLLAQQRAQDRLRATAEALRSRQTTADSERGWWVYLPAVNRGDATRLTRELATAGLEDYYVITSGAMENSVSVGLFQNLDNARSRQARLRTMGFDAQLEIRRESAPQFWVDYRIAASASTPWRYILRASPGAQHREIPCWNGG